MKHANRTAILFLTPSLAIIIAVLLFPVVQTLALSVARDTTSILRDFEWAGLANYRRLLDTPRFVGSVVNTLWFTVVTVPLELIIGIGLAMMLNRNLPAQGVVRMAVLFPWALPTALNALMWRWMFNGDYGLINAGIAVTGLSGPVNWLGSIPLAMYSMMFVAIWKTSSFIALLVLAGLQAIPHEIYEAAEVDGVTPWSKFRYVTLPLIQPAILVAVLLRTMDAMRTFELPFNLTDGGPLTSTETLSLYAYRAIFQYVDFNLGSAAIIVQFVIIMIIAAFYLATLRRDSYA